MTEQVPESFFAKMRQKLFKWRTDREIYDRIFPHHRGDKNFGYPFRTRKQMTQQTEQFDVPELFDAIERQIRQMPEAYGESFRYLMHRELEDRLRQFEKLARRRVQPASLDPRFVATHA